MLRPGKAEIALLTSLSVAGSPAPQGLGSPVLAMASLTHTEATDNVQDSSDDSETKSGSAKPADEVVREKPDGTADTDSDTDSDTPVRH